MFGVRLAVVYNVTSYAVLTFDGGVKMNVGLIFPTWTNGTNEVGFGGFIFEIASTWAIGAFHRGCESYYRGGRAYWARFAVRESFLVGIKSDGTNRATGVVVLKSGIFSKWAICTHSCC